MGSPHGATTPSSIANAAKDKLQASAREFWESSIRTFEQSMKRQTGDGSGPGESSCVNDDGNGNQVNSLESVIRVMFGSCTQGDVRDSNEPTTSCPSPQRTYHSSSRESSPRRRESSLRGQRKGMYADDIYADLFEDDEVRAEENAMNNSTENHDTEATPGLQGMRQRSTGKSSNSNKYHHDSKEPTKVVPQKVIHASSPKEKKEHKVPSVLNGVAIPKNATKGPNHAAPSNPSFDDGISAISAHTLEEMAKIQELTNGSAITKVHSDLTQDPAFVSWDGSINQHPVNLSTDSSPSRRGNRMVNPVLLSREGRSHGSKSTKGARTIWTKSTLSTQSTDFANVWRQDEQKYWDDVVKEDDDGQCVADTFDSMDFQNGDGPISPQRYQMLKQARAMRRKQNRELKPDGTITTASSSKYSAYGSESQYVERCKSGHDSGHVMNFLIMPPGTEMAEI